MFMIIYRDKYGYHAEAISSLAEGNERLEYCKARGWRARLVSMDSKKVMRDGGFHFTECVGRNY